MQAEESPVYPATAKSGGPCLTAILSASGMEVEYKDNLHLVIQIRLLKMRVLVGMIKEAVL